MIDELDHGENVDQALVSTCVQIARVFVRDSFWSLVDRWRERSSKNIREEGI
jgi:hypothetical protein